LVISKARSGFVQAVVYGGYFIMALPAGLFIEKFGYKKGIIFGLALYAIGAFSFIPAENIMSFNYFLLSLFIIGSGLTFLETAANPYVTVLGDKQSAVSRINLAQSFNGLGWIVGPLIGGLLIFKSDGKQGSIALPYTIIGIIVLIVAFFISRVKLPEISTSEDGVNSENIKKGLLNDKVFVFGVVALFFYVAAQTGINSFFINFAAEAGLTNRLAAILLSFGGMGLFMVGRFAGSWGTRYILPEKLLFAVSLLAITTMILVIFDLGTISLVALLLCFLFEAIMFPTIFALSIKNLGNKTKKGSSILIMAIVGGAISPVLMGYIGESDMSIGFIVPLVCFIVVLLYSYFLNRISYKL